MKKLLFTTVLTFILASYSGALEADTMAVDVLAETSSSWNGTPLTAYQQGQPEITILRVVIPPKMQLPLHQHPVINAGVLIKGQLTITTQDNKKIHLKAGDPIVEVVGDLHSGVNDGDYPAEIIVFYAGIKDQPITIKE